MATPLFNVGDVRNCPEGMLKHLVPPFVVFGEVGLLTTVLAEVVQVPVDAVQEVAGVAQIADSNPSEVYVYDCPLAMVTKMILQKRKIVIMYFMNNYFEWKIKKGLKHVHVK